MTIDGYMILPIVATDARAHARYRTEDRRHPDCCDAETAPYRAHAVLDKVHQTPRDGAATHQLPLRR